MHKKKLTALFSITLMTIRKWHWMSAALCFMCMLLFSVTGITLHHPRTFLPEPQVVQLNGTLPNSVLPALAVPQTQNLLAVPEAVAAWLFAEHKIFLNEKNRVDAKQESAGNKKVTASLKPGEGKSDNQSDNKSDNKSENKSGKNTAVEKNSEKEAVLANVFSAKFNRPAISETFSINRQTGEFSYEKTDKGWLAYLNDLHKGKNTGMAWVYFMDLFAVACIVFSVTGFLLLQRYANTRAKTWPLLMAGIIVPIFFMLFLIH